MPKPRENAGFDFEIAKSDMTEFNQLGFKTVIR